MKKIYFRDESKKRVEPAPKASGRKKPFWFSSIPCELAAYLAIHTFGYRMVYPGSIKLIQSYLRKFFFVLICITITKTMIRFKSFVCEDS